MIHPQHVKALVLSKTYLDCERHLIEVLGEIDKKKIWRLMGYSSFFEYVLKALGLSEGQTYTLTSVTRKCKEVPELKAAILSNEVTLSNAKRIIPVLTPSNQSEWLGKAQTLTTRNLEKEVAALNPRALVKDAIRPVSLNLSKMTFCITGETEKLFRRAQDLLSQQKKDNLNLEDTVRAMAELVIEKLDKVEKAARITERQMKSKKLEKRQKSPITKKTVGFSSFESRSIQNRTIPQHIVHAVQLRDRGECQEKLPDGTKCRKTRFIEFHHIIPISEGGFHHVHNLISLCSVHHKHRHENHGKNKNRKDQSSGA